MTAKRFISIVLIIILNFGIITAAEMPSDFAVTSVYASGIDGSFDKYKQGDTVSLENDGTIGIPVDLSVYYSADEKSSPGYNGTAVILYVINTMAERTGTDSDDEIIRSMLERGYIVTVADYKNNVRAVSPQLDKSVQAIRNNLSAGKYFTDMDLTANGTYQETFIVPSGYNISLNNVYWEFDKHAADGTFEKIIETWNTDFRSVKGETVIKWTNADGSRKEVQTAFDGSSPVWLDVKGNTDENGEYIKIKYTKANSVFDCVKKDGSPLDLNLYMHIIYPTHPTKKVPVMCLASSNEHLASGAATADRPQLAGFTLNGYAGVMYDYGYVPMARKDHYGYFDGSSSTGHISGDNLSYSLHFYNNVNIDTAAMRYVRYLAMSDEDKFDFDTEAVGVFGNSKGGWMTFLGEEDPTVFANNRYFKGHHGETRFESGKTSADGYLDGGEPQPWQSFNGQKIDSGADFVYASCGGNEMYISENHSPTFVSCHTKDNSYYTTSNAFANLCRIYDIPSVYFEIDLGHTLAQNRDLNYGVDTYNALFDFAGYYLKHDPVKVMYTSLTDGEENVSLSDNIIIKFTGPVPEKELDKISVTDSDGNMPDGYWSASYGNTQWTYNITEPLNMKAVYTLKVDETLCGDNEKPIGSEYSASFTTGNERSDSLPITADNGISYFSMKVPDLSGDAKAVIKISCANDAANVFELYEVSKFDSDNPQNSDLGEKIGEVPLRGKGLYDFDASDYLKNKTRGEIINIAVKQKKDASQTEKYFADLSDADNLQGTSVGNFAVGAVSDAPDGSRAFKVSVTTNIRPDGTGQYLQEDFYDNKTRILKNARCLGKITDSDYGRKFRISFKVYDEISRRIGISLTSRTDKATLTADYDQVLKNVTTAAGKWTDVSFDYTVYDSKYGALNNFYKTLFIIGESSGDTDRAIYFSDIRVIETVTDAVADAVYLVCSDENTDPDPEPDTTVTPYGTIPDQYSSADDYPFALFANDGTFIVAYKDYADDSSASALFGARFAKYDNVIIYLRKDYEYDSASPYNNLSFSTGTLTVDLGGHRFVCDKNPMIYAKGRHANTTAVIVKNGTVSTKKVSPLKFVYTTSSTYDGSIPKVFNIDFENVKFGFEPDSDAENLMDFNRTASTVNGIANVNFKECEFDFTSNFASSEYKLFESGDTNGKINSNVKISECKINADSLDNITLSEFAPGSSLIFDSDSETKVELPDNYDASSDAVMSSDGTKYLEACEFASGRTVYAIRMPYTKIESIKLSNNGKDISDGKYSSGNITAGVSVSAFKSSFDGYLFIAEYSNTNGIKKLVSVNTEKISVADGCQNAELQCDIIAESGNTLKVFIFKGAVPTGRAEVLFSDKQ